MNKWYRKTGVKAIVLIVAILSGAMLITNLLSLMNLQEAQICRPYGR